MDTTHEDRAKLPTSAQNVTAPTLIVMLTVRMASALKPKGLSVPQQVKGQRASSPALLCVPIFITRNCRGEKEGGMTEVCAL